MKFLFIIILFSLLLIVQSCDTTDPPAETKISLEFEDASCTEVWAKINIENISVPLDVDLMQNENLRKVITITENVTTLYIDSLLPSQTYEFQITSKQNRITSNNIEACTMDTTSHNFSWETYTFGEQGSSVLRDVAIIDENNIWTVGEIYLDDTTGGSGLHNTVNWNGNEWNIIKIPTTIYGGFVRSSVLNTIISFAEDDVWTFSNAGSYSYWNGDEWETNFVNERTGGGDKFWGARSEQIYLGGNNGSISYYNGESWQIIQTDTDLNINDIYGANNKYNNDYEILAVASDNSSERTILKINNNEVTHLSDNGYGATEMLTVWFVPNRLYYIAGRNVYKKNNLNEAKWEIQNLNNYYIHSIRGQALNDIAACGSFGEIMHFNGVNWKSYKDELGTFNGWYSSVEIKDNMIVAVGFRDREAIILVGKR